MAETDQPDLNEKLALLDLLTHAHAQADAYFETIGDAAALAANQVQDVRLEYLEKGPTVTLSEGFIDLLLTVAIQYAGDRILVDLTKNLLTRVISTREGFTLIAGRTERGDAIADIYKRLAVKHLEVSPVAGKYLLAKDFAETLQHVGGAKELYTDVPFKIVETGTKVVWHTGRQSPKLRPKYTHLSTEDSPAVAVLDNAQIYVLRHKTFQRILFEGMKNLLLVSPLSRDESDMLIKSLAPFTSPLSGKLSLTEIKQHYKLFFEACIWSRTLFPPPLIVSAGAKPEGEGVRKRGILELGGGSAWLDVGDRGRDLTEYLLDRIVNPETGRPFRADVVEIPVNESTRPLRNQLGSDTQEVALRKMLKYFEDLRTRTDELESRLPPEGQSQWHYPQVTRTEDR